MTLKDELVQETALKLGFDKSCDGTFVFVGNGVTHVPDQETGQIKERIVKIPFRFDLSCAEPDAKSILKIAFAQLADNYATFLINLKIS